MRADILTAIGMLGVSGTLPEVLGMRIACGCSFNKQG